MKTRALSIVVVPLLLGGLLAAEAVVPTDMTGPFRDAVETRLRDGGDALPRRTFKRLNKAFRLLSDEPDGFAVAGQAVGKAAKQVERVVPEEDPLLTVAATAVEVLGGAAADDFDSVAGRLDALPDGRSRNRAARLTGKAGDLILAAATATPSSRRARVLARACRLLERAGRYAPAPDDPEPPADPVPDIALTDVNVSSPTWNAAVSPRDHLGGVSAWYFGHST